MDNLPALRIEVVDPSRNVAITADRLAAIDQVIEREHVTLTEPVHRLVTYGDLWIAL